ncbi:MAG TPA: ATP-binding protein [Candidatus Krumholzibacteria bacterium]|nr:ATP-binding protein [Candidatus Krumholzibacteria bacterium]
MQASADTTATSSLADALRRYWVALAAVALVTVLHYNTAIHIHAAHGIYRRLYYFPIILAAFRGGRRGGVGAAVLVCLLYIPHAFGFVGFDPANTVEKVLEMILYLAVGLLTGSLTSRIAAARDREAATAADLRTALAEKTAMEAELVRSARLAAVGRLSAGLAHEIRNPLASIRGTAEILADDFAPEHPKGRMLGILKDETGRLNDVLTRFLAFARSEPGEASAFDLAGEARAVADLVRARPDSPPIDVNAGVALPRALANREQVRQVLLNLALNGGAAAGPAGRITIMVDTADGALRCRVCDTGPGFSAEALANFGTPFYSTRDGGTGLGLATSLRLVEDQGGTLAVDTGHTRGACVVMTLPAAPDEEDLP